MHTSNHTNANAKIDTNKIRAQNNVFRHLGWEVRKMFANNPDLCISLAIRQGHPLSKCSQMFKSALCTSAIRWDILFQNDPKNLDPSCKEDLDFWDYFRRGNPLKMDLDFLDHFGREYLLSYISNYKNNTPITPGNAHSLLSLLCTETNCSIGFPESSSIMIFSSGLSFFLFHL